MKASRRKHSTVTVHEIDRYDEIDQFIPDAERMASKASIRNKIDSHLAFVAAMNWLTAKNRSRQLTASEKKLAIELYGEIE